MKQKDEFIFDFSVILHSHSAYLINITQWLEPIKKYMGKDPFYQFDEVTDIEAEKILQVPIQYLKKTIDNILAKVNDAWNERKIPDIIKNSIIDLNATLSDYISSPEGNKFRPPYVFDQVNRLLDILPKKNEIKISNSLYRCLLDEIKEVQRVICYYYINIAILNIREMDFQTESLREFYAYSNRVQEPMQTISVSRLIMLTMRDKGGFAYRRNIHIDYKKRIDATVFVRKNDILRVFSHLLNNAIKYNYLLRDNRVWVEIKSYIEKNYICIEFENWGTPITQDEIEKEYLFKVGTRGSYATKKISGNGIGLADTKRVIEDHGGLINIKSIPARKEYSINDYSKPFLTTVTVKLPKYNKTP